MAGLIAKVVALFGGLFNRIRGGADIWFGENAPANKIWFPIFLGIVTFNPWVVLGCYVGQQICGWGAYIGSLTTGTKPVEECKAIDWLCQPFEDKPRLWGFIALTFRGLLWTACIAASMLNPWVTLLGLWMPVSYAVATAVLYKTKYNNTKASWNLGEIIWGILLTYGVIECLNMTTNC